MPTLTLQAAHQSRLYGITDDALMPNEQLFSKVEAALKAGLAFLQYRQKSGTFAEREQQARRLLTLCRRYHTPLIINDDLALAIAIDADGLHLGQTDGSVAEARQQLGVDKIIGATCHDSLELAAQAIQEGASYIAFGRFFASKTKPHARPADLSILRLAKQRFHCPVVAIGGINQDNAQQLIENGADYIAVVHSLFASEHPDQAVKDFQNRLSPAPL